MQYDTYILPIEVKSGKSTSSRSLTLYNADKHPILRIRYSDKDLKLENGSNIEAATKVGEAIAEKAKKATKKTESAE